MSPAFPAHLTNTRTNSLNLRNLALWLQRAFRPGQPHPTSETTAPVPPPSDRPLTDPATTARELSQRLVAVQEAVRRDMADYLHGHVQSKLLALSLYLAHCQDLLAQDPNSARQLLSRIQMELQKLQDEDVRQVSRELYPAIIKMGLVPALRSLLSRFDDSLEIDLVIDAEVFALDAQGETYLPEKQRLGVYRIAEEALNNALKHAQATQVEVSLICQGGHQLVLSVRDNGRGFDPSRVSSSHGVMLMTDYAEAMGGQTAITSAPGQGTTVTLVLPLPAPAQPVAVGVNPN